MTLPRPTLGVRAAIRKQVVAVFNDRQRGETPVVRSDQALFPPQSVIWRVHGDVGSMMVGGIASLLLQMLHPSVLGGIWDHSNFREDMHGRLRRTARFIAMTTYGEREMAQAAIARVRGVHSAVIGTLPDGTPYTADDPALLAWVHVTETRSFLDAWIRYGEPGMSLADQDRYFAEAAMIGEALGASPVPRSRREATQLIMKMKSGLMVDDRTHDVARLLLSDSGRQGPDAITDIPRKLAVKAAVDLLPDWARSMHGLSVPPLAKPLVRMGTFGVAQTLRWAFR